MRVVVLMSTYNGERFIEEQVASILKQLPPEGRLMVRDDGSTDRTVEKLKHIHDNRIQIEEGENIGFARSFLTLLTRTPQDVQMVMFSDQDDVWLEDKVLRAWTCLSAVETQPALYCCRQLVTDIKLKIRQESERINHKPTFMNAIAENIVTGCTAALNEKAINLMKISGVPEHVKFHDWWLYLVISAHGIVIADNNAFILYRQHGNNYLGRGFGRISQQVNMVKFLMKNNWVDALFYQLIDLEKNYNKSLSKECKKIIADNMEFNGNKFCARWAFIFGKNRWTRSVSRDIFLRILLLIHRLN